MADSYTIIPAQAGWHVALYVEGEETFDLLPIIAWEVSTMLLENERAHDATPVVVGGLPSNVWAIKWPNGTFDFPYLATFNDETKAIAFAKTLRK